MNALLRYAPSRELDSLRREMNRLFEDFSPGRRADNGETESAVWTPRADLAENEEAYVLVLDLPGIDKDTLAITMDDGVLKISGERHFESEDTGHQFHRIERSYGKFFRSFRVGNAVDAEGIDASFENGVLTVTLPKAEERKPRRIEVK